MSNEKTNWGQSAAAVVIKDNSVLLVRHTYGSGKGLLIIPGGYIQYNETPQDAVKREIFEETSIKAEPKNIIGIRFNFHDWYIVFSAEYISGTPQSDMNENSEALWLDINEALERDDVAGLTKSLIKCALAPDSSLSQIPYSGNPKHGDSSLYGSLHEV